MDSLKTQVSYNQNLELPSKNYMNTPHKVYTNSALKLEDQTVNVLSGIKWFIVKWAMCKVLSVEPSITIW